MISPLAVLAIIGVSFMMAASATKLFLQELKATSPLAEQLTVILAGAIAARILSAIGTYLFVVSIFVAAVIKIAAYLGYTV